MFSLNLSAELVQTHHTPPHPTLGCQVIQRLWIQALDSTVNIYNFFRANKPPFYVV